MNKINLRTQPKSEEPKAEKPKAEEIVQYVLHVDKDPSSISVGSDSTPHGARQKARNRAGVTYMYKYTTTVDADGTDTLQVEYIEPTGR